MRVLGMREEETLPDVVWRKGEAGCRGRGDKPGSTGKAGASVFVGVLAGRGPGGEGRGVDVAADSAPATCSLLVRAMLAMPYMVMYRNVRNCAGRGGERCTLPRTALLTTSTGSCCAACRSQEGLQFWNSQRHAPKL